MTEQEIPSILSDIYGLEIGLKSAGFDWKCFMVAVLISKVVSCDFEYQTKVLI